VFSFLNCDNVENPVELELHTVSLQDKTPKYKEFASEFGPVENALSEDQFWHWICDLRSIPSNDPGDRNCTFNLPYWRPRYERSQYYDSLPSTLSREVNNLTMDPDLRDTRPAQIHSEYIACQVEARFIWGDFEAISYRWGG
jgi:hypothetical protein